MTETNQDFDVYEEDIITLEITVPGANLGGKDVTMIVDTYKGGDRVFEKSTANSGVSIPDDETIIVTLTGSDTDLYASGEEDYYHRIYVEETDGNVTVTTGTMTVHE